MRCPKIKLISAYLDQEAGLHEKTAFEAHVQGCNICSHTLEEMRSLRAAFATAERHPAPYGFASRVMVRTAALESPSPYPIPLGERIKVRGGFVPLFIKFAEAAVLLIVITVGILAGRAMTYNYSSAKTTNMASSLSLELFDATPPGSLGGAYLAMTEVSNEK
jgi:anti-sigma factor RsiW